MPKQVIFEAKDFQSLLDVLTAKKYINLGPTVRDDTIVYDRLWSASDLPIGRVDDQDGGRYRLVKEDRERFFAFIPGQDSWKKFLFPPEKVLFEVTKSGKGFKIDRPESDGDAMAFIGVRACELKAIEIQDKILMGGPDADAFYAERRKRSFIVAVNCVRAGGTCFCVSMNTGPRAAGGFDLALTEIFDSQRHVFLAEIGSKEGGEVMSAVPHQPATEDDLGAAEQAIGKAASQMGRRLNMATIKESLERNFEHPHWQEIAMRCLACGNCTMVCPTCFCFNVSDVTDFSGEKAVRRRRWDSCFNADHSYIYGGNIRNSSYSRYRQWMMHKLAYWFDQFDSAGCVGCGRCITWCPVGIDLTEEAAFFEKAK